MASYELWIGSYMTCGIICLGIGVLYAIFVARDLQSSTPKLPGYKSSQIVFIIACLFRGIGWIIFAILIINNGDFDIEKYLSPILLGIPGYILTISYALLFYLWSSICVNLIANDSTTGLKEIFKKTLTITLTIIVTLACALIGVTIFFLFLESEDLAKSIHIFEGSLAVMRDFATGSIILFFTIRIIRMLQRPFCSSKSNESIYCWMLLCIIGALYIRCISLIIFLKFHIDGPDEKISNFLNTFITAILAELLPCFMVFITRRRSGLLSVYDLIE